MQGDTHISELPDREEGRDDILPPLVVHKYLKYSNDNYDVLLHNTGIMGSTWIVFIIINS